MEMSGKLGAASIRNNFAFLTAMTRLFQEKEVEYMAQDIFFSSFQCKIDGKARVEKMAR